MLCPCTADFFAQPIGARYRHTNLDVMYDNCLSAMWIVPQFKRLPPLWIKGWAGGPCICCICSSSNGIETGCRPYRLFDFRTFAADSTGHFWDNVWVVARRVLDNWIQRFHQECQWLNLRHPQLLPKVLQASASAPPGLSSSPSTRFDAGFEPPLVFEPPQRLRNPWTCEFHCKFCQVQCCRPG